MYVGSVSGEETAMGLYVIPNFRTKKAFKEAVKNGDPLSYFQYGPWGGNEHVTALHFSRVLTLPSHTRGTPKLI